MGRFEEGPQPVVFHLRNRVELVVVTARALDRDAEESPRGVLDRGTQPFIAAEDVPVADEVPGGPERGRVIGSELIPGKHLEDHAIIPLVGVERLDDPVAPAPEVWVAVAELAKVPVLVAVPPDVHPVSGPSLAVSGA